MAELGRPFRRFWTAAVLANLGDGIRLAAFPLLAASLTDDPLGVAAVAAAGTLPWLLTGLLAGSLADRHDARSLLLAADAARLLTLAALVAVVATGRASLGVVAAGALVLGVAETLRDTTTETVVPRLVPAALLERANGRMVAGTLVGNEFVGPLAGGVLFAAGAALPFVVNSGLVALAVLLVLSVPAAALHAVVPLSGGPAARRGVLAGLRWLSRDRLLRALVLTTIGVAVADSAWFSVFVLLVEQRLQLGPSAFGVLLATGALGGLGGSLVAERVIRRARHGPVVTAAAAVAGVTPVLLVVSAAPWAAVVVVVSTSAAFAVYNVTAASMRQRLVPEALRGRVTAAWRTGVYGAAALGALAGGALASRLGLAAPLVLSGVLGAGVAAGWWLTSRQGWTLP